jgi:hypothetical protein
MNQTKQADAESMQVVPEDASEDKPFHPFFSSSDGNIILGAKGGTLFWVHSYTLKTMSGWFRTMFSLPQKSAPAASDIIYVDEDAYTLESLLRMICGLPIMHVDSYDAIDALLYAGEFTCLNYTLMASRKITTTIQPKNMICLDPCQYAVSL